MIKRVYLTNFRRHADLVVVLGRGLNLVVGENASGKSTLLYAIAYALGGARAVPGKAEDLTRWGSSGAMEVGLLLEVAGVEYLVTRTLRTATLKAGAGDVLATGHSAVTAEIEERILGCSWKDFRAFQVTSQGDSTDLLDSGSAQLSEHVSRVTGVDLIDSVVSRGSAEVATAKAVLLSLDDQSQILEDLGAQECRLQGEEGAAADRQALAEQSLGACFQRKQDLADKFEVMSKARSEYLAWSSETDEHRRALEDVEGRVAWQRSTLLGYDTVRLPEAVRDLEALKASESAWTYWNNRAAAAGSQIEQAKQALEQLPPVDTGPLRVRVETLTADLAEARKGADRCSVLLDQARQEAQSSACAYCGRPFEGADPNSLQARVGSLQFDYDAWAGSVFRLSSDLEVAEKQLRAAVDGYSRRAAWEAFLTSYEAERRDLGEAPVARPDAAELARLGQEVTHLLSASMAQRRAQDELAQLERAAEAHRARYQEAVRRVPHGAPTEQEVDLVKQDLADALRYAHQAELDLVMARGLRESLAQDLARVRAALEVSRSIQDKRDTWTARHDGLAQLLKFLRGNRDRYLGRVWQDLLSLASGFVQEATGGRLEGVGRTDGGEFTYQEDGQPRVVAGNASGFQQAAISVAIKLALASAVCAKFGVLLFDEVTGAGTEESALSLTGALSKLGQQVILVSHRDTDAVAAQNVVRL